MTDDSRSQSRFARRRVLQAGAAAGAGAALAWGASSGAAGAAAPTESAGAADRTAVPRQGADRPGSAGWFSAPGAAVRPKFRWWWPDGLVDPAEIQREIDQIADAGFGGVEIAAVHHSVDDPAVLDTAHHGWGSASWVAGVEAALEQADRRGLTVDITAGPAWPTAVPTITPDSAAAVQELAHGVVAVAGGTTYTGPVPAAVVAADPAARTSVLFAVQAVRIDTANTTKKETGLDPATLVDLTCQVRSGAITWTAPDDGGSWLLLGYWQRGTGQTPEAGPHTVPTAYVVDHFSAAGTRAVIDFWESDLLTHPIRRLIGRVGGSLFEDSIELESDALLWTSALPAEFARRRGYPLLPYLPVVVLSKSNQVYAYDAALTVRVRHDFWQTVSELYNAQHVTAIKKWAGTVGLKLRAQPYGLQTDAIATAAILDIPEGESLGFKNLDDFRCLAGGRDMAGSTILSCESGAYTGGAYNTTWQKFLRTMGGAYAAGVNQTVIHGFSYATLPGTAWPGYAAFTPYHGAVGYGESWGPRQPTWRHIEDMSGYLARIHQVLQAGKPRLDVAIFRQTGYTATGIGASWFTSTGIPLGWNHEFISEPLLSLPSAHVTQGRLAAGGPAYQALFVEADFFAGSTCTLPVAVAEKFLAFTKAGLPIVLLGDWSTATVPGRDTGGQDERLRAVLTELLAQPRVRQLTDKTAVGAALADLGVEPVVSYATSSTLLNAHRYADGADYYYLCNGKHAETVKPPVAAIDHDVTFRRGDSRQVPYLLDLWTGRVERVGAWTEDGDKATLRVALQPGETMVVAFGAPGMFGDRTGAGPHAVSTTADEARFDGGELVVRSATDGDYTTALSHGRPVRSRISGVPLPTELTAWQLDVEDWQPGADANRTTIVRRRVGLDALVAWPDVPELADVSGIGRYRTTVRLGAAWTGGHGAYLQLGTVYDTCRVTVNGRLLDPVDHINPVVDLGGHLRAGDNTIEVEVATTLGNRLRVSDPVVYGASPRQPYGLVGPVRLVPYGQARLG
ncbi:alpha-L-rhamnosidase [Streptomyces sp. DvalAA-14]|uniref:glycosyl hydrolase n=1 Tax=unclassified Streptomyces TaxID=2593676 RepID=UPI00081B012B|nr:MULTISPECIES: glycosyl hydrolase [unclassified Streptomyces]MYS20273.1 alpha-L-rhamnosidase [Streptomyces sp. SID4948]SCD65001.1 alpha-L-rhamnosidase [Streptomyces sp. DvalAA-14]